MTSTRLQAALRDLPDAASEAVIGHQFIAPHFLAALGFQNNEIYPQYATGNGWVDYAARKNSGDDIFLNTKLNPQVLIELKGKDVNLAEGSASYASTFRQLKGYLLAPECKTVEWGIMTNAVHIQLFRKHGKVVHPATPCLEITSENIEKITAEIKCKIDTPTKALTVAIYNNKGGVGKTTTTVNLGAVLQLSAHKKVLIMDLDPNQQDLTNSLGIPLKNGEVHKFLTEKYTDIDSCIHRHSINHKNKQIAFFDVIPADQQLVEADEVQLRQSLKLDTLYQKLESIKSKYDYILIDSPPNWRVFSQLAVLAADVILIPTKHNNIFSLENAALAMKQFIPEAQKLRTDGGPIPLPIFFNGEKPTVPQLVTASQAIDNILKQAKNEGFNLISYFYPKCTKANKNRYIFMLDGHANIANAAFSRIPAAYRDITARAYYLSLAEEYFLQ